MHNNHCFMCEEITLLRVKKSLLHDLDLSIQFKENDNEIFSEEVSICSKCFNDLEKSKHANEFRECPFCKSSGSLNIVPITYNGSSFIICHVCKATGPEVKLVRVSPEQTEKSIKREATAEATTLWNKAPR